MESSLTPLQLNITRHHNHDHNAQHVAKGINNLAIRHPESNLTSLNTKTSSYHLTTSHTYNPQNTTFCTTTTYTMPATIFARTAARRAATFCTSSRAMKPSADSGISMNSPAASPSNSWAWSNLAPQTRRYVKIGAATCAATDAFVLYNYPEWVGLKRASE